MSAVDRALAWTTVALAAAGAVAFVALEIVAPVLAVVLATLSH